MAPSVEPSTSQEPIAWQRVGSFGREGGWDRVTGIAHGDAGFMAIGDRIDTANEVGYRPAGEYLWASDDGREWQQLPLPQELGDARLAAVAAAPTHGFILYAYQIDEAGGTHPLVLATSEDVPSGWVVVDTGLPEEMYITKVVRGSAGLLMPQHASDGGDPGLWFSEDGLSWELTHQFEQVNEYVGISDVGAGDEGFVAVGYRTTLDSTDATRFTIASGDGHEWFETAEPFGREDPSYRPDAFVAPLGPDWIATVPAQDDSARFWFSANGLEWRQAGHIDDLATTQAWAPALFPVADEVFFSVAANDLPGTIGPWSGFMSTDGDRWHTLAFDAAAVVRAGASGPGWRVFAGSLTTSDGSRATFWYLAAD